MTLLWHSSDCCWIKSLNIRFYEFMISGYVDWLPEKASMWSVKISPVARLWNVNVSCCQLMCDYFSCFTLKHGLCLQIFTFRDILDADYSGGGKMTAILWIPYVYTRYTTYSMKWVETLWGCCFGFNNGQIVEGRGEWLLVTSLYQESTSMESDDV